MFFLTWFSFPFTIRDQNCLTSSVSVAFHGPIHSGGKWERQFWLECDMGSTFPYDLVFLVFHSSFREKNCLISSVIVASPLTNSEADPFRRKIRRRFWLECEEGWSLAFLHPPSHSSLPRCFRVLFVRVCVCVCGLVCASLRAAQHFVTTISSASGDDIVWRRSKWSHISRLFFSLECFLSFFLSSCRLVFLCDVCASLCVSCGCLNVIGFFVFSSCNQLWLIV